MGLKEKIEQATQTKTVTVNGEKIKIRALTVGDLSVSDSENIVMAAHMISRSLVEPEISYSEALKIPLTLSKELVSHINELNGLDEDADEAIRGN